MSDLPRGAIAFSGEDDDAPLGPARSWISAADSAEHALLELTLEDGALAEAFVVMERAGGWGQTRISGFRTPSLQPPAPGLRLRLASDSDV